MLPMFVEIYIQVYCAERNKYKKGLAGVGDRKAIEYLIKDYYLAKIDPDNKDNIVKYI